MTPGVHSILLCPEIYKMDDVCCCCNSHVLLKTESSIGYHHEHINGMAISGCFQTSKTQTLVNVKSGDHGLLMAFTTDLLVPGT